MDETTVSPSSTTKAAIPKAGRSALTFVAPEESPQHCKLRAAARKAGQDEETLRDLLWLINAHDRLLGLRQITTNLLQIFDSLDLHPVDESSEADSLDIFRGWPKLLHWIDQTWIDTEPPKTLAKNRAPLSPINGQGVGRHPFYAFLWHTPQDARWNKRYACLQWHLLWAHASYLWRESQHTKDFDRTAYEGYGGQEMWEAFPNSPYSATLSARQLSTSQLAPLLRLLPLHLTPSLFANALIARQVGSEDAEERRALNFWLDHQSLKSFLSKANGVEPWDERTGGSSGPRFKYAHREVRSTYETPGDPDDPDALWPSGRSVTVSAPIDLKRQDELRALDINPEETAREPENLYLVDPNNGGQDPQQLAVQSALAARGQSRHIQLAHQLLPWQYNQLSLQELRHLLHSISVAAKQLRKVPQLDAEQYRSTEFLALIHVMLWTGSSLERACNLKVLTKSDTQKYKLQQICEQDLLFDIETHEWRIRAVSPIYKSDIPDLNRQAYPLEPSLLLPDIAETEIFLRLLVQRRLPSPGVVSSSSNEPTSPQVTRRQEGYVFLGDVNEYGPLLKNWLAKPINNPTGRLTVSRIASFLFNHLTAMTDDIMVAVLITGHSHPQARTQQYYGTYRVTTLQQKYLNATKPIVEAANNAAGRKAPERIRQEDGAQKGHVGARLCATHDAVKKAVSLLKKDIANASQIGDRAASIKFHNLYTLYTVLLFSYATSMRAIRTNYIQLLNVDQGTGFTFISDKDDDARNKTRLAWVPPFVYQQMQSYADHLAALSSDNPTVGSWSSEPCFFLDEKGKPLEVRPLTLGEHMRPYLALPPNAHRRFMRHELLDHHCSPEVVNAWLGHAFQGEEPWGPYSSFSFEEYRTALKDHLVPILREGLGWTNLTSPLS